MPSNNTTQLQYRGPPIDNSSPRADVLECARCAALRLAAAIETGDAFETMVERQALTLLFTLLNNSEEV